MSRMFFCILSTVLPKSLLITIIFIVSFCIIRCGEDQLLGKQVHQEVTFHWSQGKDIMFLMLSSHLQYQALVSSVCNCDDDAYFSLCWSISLTLYYLQLKQRKSLITLMVLQTMVSYRKPRQFSLSSFMRFKSVI